MAGEITKKFINTVEKVVDDSIKGLVASNKNLQLHKKCNRVVLRSDLRDLKIVTLIAGGGSGHEPFPAGYVGKGFLTAAVCGDIFTSPPSSYVTTALEAVSNQKGVVVLVINYTGDRLNFGLAVERFNQSQTTACPALMVVIGDDIALEQDSQENVGRRGLAGSIVIMKMAGAMAEKGLSSDKIAVMAQKANGCTGTLGVSVSACSFPGKGPMFTLKPDEMELGLGIHGEAGCQRTKLLSAKEVINLMLGRLAASERLSLPKGAKVAVLLNNLGGTCQIEMNLLAGEIRSWMHEHDYSMVRFYYGTLMSSLNGHGFSITVLKIADDAWLEYLDAPTNAPAWTFKECDVSREFNVCFGPIKRDVTKTKYSSDIALDEDGSKKFYRCLERACNAILENEERLNNLDSQSGDGDCGHTLAKGAARVLSALNSGELTCVHPQAAFKTISLIFEEEVGGTAGAIYALMFSAAASGFEGTSLPSAWHMALKMGLKAVMRYGEARPGDRSMVDPLNAAVEAITDGNYTQKDWENLVKLAEAAAESTVSMKARCGRASYTAEATQTMPDPGAIAVAIWLRAAYEAAFVQ